VDQGAAWVLGLPLIPQRFGDRESVKKPNEKKKRALRTHLLCASRPSRPFKLLGVSKMREEKEKVMQS